MDLTTVPDLVTYLRDPDLDMDTALLLVDMANGVVSDLIDTEPDPVPARLGAIALEVAARAYRNPGGYSSETIDDYTYRRDASTRAAGVYLTDDETAEVRRLVGSGTKVRNGWAC